MLVKVVPSLSKFNQFEDLLSKTDIVISFHFASTTVWQSLSNRIPTISCNHSFEHSFLKDFTNLEFRIDELEDSYNYYKNNDHNFETTLLDLDAKTNLLKEDSLDTMLKHIVNIAHE